MEGKTRDARQRAQRPRRARGPDGLGWRWFILRGAAATVGFFGWLVGASGAFCVALGAVCITWARRLHTAADELRYEA